MRFTTVRLEGALFSDDLLAKVAAGEAPGQKAGDFGLDGKIRLSDEIASCWSDARAYWEAFKHGLARAPETETGATVTREQWVLPLLASLGFQGIAFSRTAAQAGGQTYAISHRVGDPDKGLPVHIEGARVKLDERPLSGRPRISPQGMVQEYLNCTEHIWAMVTNGEQLRLLRNSTRMSRPTYLEFDLKGMMEGEQFSEFQVFYRLVHRSRWPANLESASECWLERYYLQSIEEGGRVREQLRYGVEEALKIFGNGFLSHPANDKLRQKISSGNLSAGEYYRQLLRLIYRFLFLMVSEERKLVGPDPADDRFFKIYSRYYSISRLRDKVERPVNPMDRYSDLWESVKQNFWFYAYSADAEKLKMKPLNGDLFGPDAMRDLEETKLLNVDFLKAFAHLSLFKDSKVTGRINYGYLDVEEMGSVYESLLDYHPVFQNKNGILQFELLFGMERKSTGSYYTRPELVHELIKSALEPVIQERLAAAATKEEKERALLNIKICDLTVGSGHFLLAAARRLGRELAKIRSGEDEPVPAQFRLAVRDIIQHCIYGVDLNPLAVDLCKVALWLEGHNRNLPLTFLDHRIKCGNSLVGLDRLDRIKDGIPDDAFNPVTVDDRETAKRIKSRNKAERTAWQKGQIPLTPAAEGKLQADFQTFVKRVEDIERLPEKTTDDIRLKQKKYVELHDSPEWRNDSVMANIWTAAFFYPLKSAEDPAIATQGRLLQFLNYPQGVDGRLVGMAVALAEKHRFFHWPLEFPEVIYHGGFDVILGNPPWERIKLQELEFFAIRDPQIAGALNKAERAKLISSLEKNKPALAQEFAEAKHAHESDSRFVRTSKRFPLTAVGDINTYALFAELARKLINSKGRAGIIIPTGLATDDTLKDFFADLMLSRALASFYGMENEALFYFPSVHHSYRFALASLAGSAIQVPQSEFTFFCRFVENIHDPMRIFTLTANDLQLLNPNTRTCPVFRTNIDAQLAKKIYHEVPILENERTSENPWDIKFMTMFHMSNDSHLFATQPKEGYVPLYEAKMIHQFDHRWATYDGVSFESIKKGLARDVKISEKENPFFAPIPRYWVSSSEVAERIPTNSKRRWLLVFRDITSAVVERTAIFSLIPLSGVGNSILFSNKPNAINVTCLLACVNSLIFDYLARHKIGGTHINFFIAKQFAALSQDKFTSTDLEFIAPRVLELVYTAWDLKPFAEDVGYQGEPFKWDVDRRALLRAELDAYYAYLYGLSRDELRYILDPQDVYGPDFPGETFRVLKEREIKQLGEYRTRRLVLEAWDRLFGKGGTA